jgi:hypothetical protein
MANSTKGKTVSVRLHEVTKVAMDMIISRERLKTGKRLTNDGVLWYLLRNSEPGIVEQVRNSLGELPAEIEVDKRFKGDS